MSIDLLLFERHLSPVRFVPPADQRAPESKGRWLMLIAWNAAEPVPLRSPDTLPAKSHELFSPSPAFLTGLLPESRVSPCTD